MISKTLKIEGMTCASCAKAVERAVHKLDGVNSANVNFATEKLNIVYETSLINLSDMKMAIEKAGYNAIDEEVVSDTDKEKKEKEIQLIWKKFIVSAIFTLPLLYISMGH